MACLQALFMKRSLPFAMRRISSVWGEFLFSSICICIQSLYSWTIGFFPPVAWPFYPTRWVLCMAAIQGLFLDSTVLSRNNQNCQHCKCDWTDTGAKQGFSQLIVELCRENIGKNLYWLSLFKKQGLSQTQQ